MTTSESDVCAPTTATGCLVQAAEVWLPAAAGRSWELVEAAHARPELAPTLGIRPAGDGLLDRVVRSGCAQVAEHLDADECASRNGGDGGELGGALAVPSYVDGELVAVTLLLLGPGPGAAECWGGAEGEHALALERVLAPGLQRWARIGFRVRFPLGSGLPGRVWRCGQPLVEAGIDVAKGFMRSSSAASEGLAHAVAWPVVSAGQLRNVVVLLGGAAAPVARAVEIWQPTGRDGAVTCGLVDGFGPAELLASAKHRHYQPGADLIGRAWALRRPVVTAALTADGGERGPAAVAAGCHAACTWPVVVGDRVTAILQWWW